MENNTIIALGMIGSFVLLLMIFSGVVELFFYFKEKIEQRRYEKRTKMFRSKVSTTWREM